MPQIFVILGEPAQGLTKEQLKDLMQRFTKIVEKVFDIENENDVAHTIVDARQTGNEKDFQVEYRYTVGTDEYGRGKIFNPSMKKQDLLIEQTAEAFVEFLRDHKLSLSISVWSKPSRGGRFKAFEKPTNKF